MVLFSSLATSPRQRSEECKAEINAHRPTCAAVQLPHPHAWYTASLPFMREPSKSHRAGGEKPPGCQRFLGHGFQPTDSIDVTFTPGESPTGTVMGIVERSFGCLADCSVAQLCLIHHPPHFHPTWPQREVETHSNQNLAASYSPMHEGGGTGLGGRIY